MKKIIQCILPVLFIAAAIFTISCGDDDPITDNNTEPTPTGKSKTFALNTKAVDGISGTAKFIENSDASTTIELKLTGTPDAGAHPAHIHVNTAAETGSIAVTLGIVDGTTGMSTITISELDDKTSITYDQLLDFDGYINVHMSASDLGTIVAQGDIGQNELTGTSKEYALAEKDGSGISGTVTFHERVNGESLAILALTNTPEGGSHPAHIHASDVVTGGGVVFTFNAVDGTSGMSATNVAALDGDGGALKYADILTFNGYVAVHESTQNIANVVAVGNIGANEDKPTTVTKSYDVVNSGTSAYLFTGEGLTSASNPDITLKRGVTYEFTIDAPGHPFLINTVQGTGTANKYENGVTNNGASSGKVIFTVPQDAPATLFYNCQHHGSMTGEITITD